MDNGFKWIAKDVSDSIIINLFYKDNGKLKLYSTYDASMVLDVVGNEIDVEFANIDSLTNFITMGMVRFINVKDSSDIIDIPIRKLALLYDNASNMSEILNDKKVVSINDLDAFAIVDGKNVKDNYFVEIIKIREPHDSLMAVIDSSLNYGNMGMQEKFDTLSDINNVNYRRIREINN